MSLARTIVKSTLPPGVTVRLRAAFKRHEHERALLPALCDPLRAALDIGAALGAYTWPLSRLCQSVIAFEPNPTQAQYLRRAFGASARVESLALSNRTGEIELVIPLENGRDLAGLATIGPGKWLEGKPVRYQKVAVRTLDSFSLGAVGFIKLDVEGHELAVLEGAICLLRRDKPTLLVELEERFATGSIARVREFLDPLGYSGYFLREGRMWPISSFDLDKYQAIEKWGVIGAYINNFVFVAENNRAITQQRLADLGFPMVS